MVPLFTRLVTVQTPVRVQTQLLPDFRDALRPFQGRPPEAHPPLGLGRGDALRLPLPDELPFRLGHVAQQLQNDVGDQRPGEILVFPGVQQGHVQHHDGRPFSLVMIRHCSRISL